VMEVVAVKLPEAPVMVIVPFPGTAVLLAVSVKVLELVALAELKLAMTPAGKPDADRFTALLNPFCPAMLIVLVPLAPCTTLRLLGDADSVKLGAAVTVKATEVVAVRLPDVPMTVTVALPSAALLLAASVNVLDVVALAGLNVAVTPAGKPEAERFTAPLNPFWPAMVIVAVPLVPCTTLKLLGAAESVKLAGTTTFTLTEVMLVSAPELPVIVAVKFPAAALLSAVRVSKLELDVLLGLNAAITPAGKPLTARLTVPLNPFCGAMLIVVVALPPWTMLTLAGDAESAKFGEVGEISETLSNVAPASSKFDALLTAMPM